MGGEGSGGSGGEVAFGCLLFRVCLLGFGWARAAFFGWVGFGGLGFGLFAGVFWLVGWLVCAGFVGLRGLGVFGWLVELWGFFTCDGP